MCCDTEVETVARTPIGEGIGIVVGCRQLTSRLKHQNPVVKPGFVLVPVCKYVGRWAKSHIIKRPSHLGRPSN